jgi:hypothetical protein
MWKIHQSPSFGHAQPMTVIGDLPPGGGEASE